VQRDDRLRVLNRRIPNAVRTFPASIAPQEEVLGAAGEVLAVVVDVVGSQDRVRRQTVALCAQDVAPLSDKVVAVFHGGILS
jgi:hypothetical protein